MLPAALVSGLGAAAQRQCEGRRAVHATVPRASCLPLLKSRPLGGAPSLRQQCPARTGLSTAAAGTFLQGVLGARPGRKAQPRLCRGAPARPAGCYWSQRLRCRGCRQQTAWAAVGGPRPKHVQALRFAMLVHAMTCLLTARLLRTLETMCEVSASFPAHVSDSLLWNNRTPRFCLCNSSLSHDARTDACPYGMHGRCI